jgi:DNA-binding MarR family transcriptional regulator
MLHESGVPLRLRETWILAAINEKPCSQSKCAKVLDINPNVMVRHVDRLEKLDLIQRAQDPKNRRENVLRVTKKGRETLRNIYAIKDAALLEVFAPLSIADINLLREKCKYFIKSYKY